MAAKRVAKNRVRVPRTPKGAFNPHRPASDLLRAQITHLEWATRQPPQRVSINSLDMTHLTEGQAAAYIATLHQRCHAEALTRKAHAVTQAPAAASGPATPSNPPAPIARSAAKKKPRGATKKRAAKG